MTRDDVLDFALEQASQGQPVTLTKEMQALVDADPTLAEELACTQAFWQTPERDMPRPSAALRDGFYSMLEEAKATQHASAPPRAELWERVSKWLHWGPVAQFASLAIVFVVGLQVGEQRQGGADTSAMLALEQQVSSLSTVVALSMLQQPTASERLHGVAYSNQSVLLAPALIEQFMTVLREDESSAVRLAVIERLNSLPSLDNLTDSLVEIAITSDSPLVQIELIRLLHSKASAGDRMALFKKLAASEFDAGVQNFIRQLRESAQV